MTNAPISNDNKIFTAAILAEPVSDNPKLSLAESQIADK